MVKFNFVGHSNLTTFSKNTKRKWDDDDYVTIDFQGKGGVGKKKVKVVPNIKTEMAVLGGLGGTVGFLTQANKGWKAKLAGATIGGVAGAGASYLGRKRMRDMDGRSDKGKKRKY